MRHNRDEKRFDRTWSHLRSMFANMTNDLVMAGRIRTTLQRAKSLRSHAEKMITLGKNGSLHARRRAMAFMRSKEAVTRLFEEVAPQFKERNGGYTRILKLGWRPGDNADMAIIELVEGAGALKAAEEKARKPAKAKKPAVKKEAAPKAEKAPKAPKAEKTPKAKEAKAEGAAEKPAKKTAAKKEGAEKKTATKAKKTGKAE